MNVFDQVISQVPPNIDKCTGGYNDNREATGDATTSSNARLQRKKVKVATRHP